ncbi:hypothetical protein UFOVP618_53 [uncultured Caudovirales phage]|uniref:Uncharacterized protein n=1 Tax=uncultured Caudovirales phage TaxID=2100421 RepID=A0A6J5N7R7_9CAUD|nr:hypothetical protein UFOVP618_53 [uncultured Caudovirales phage]
MKIFKKGDKVYCVIHGHGVVVNIEENLDFPVRVDAKNESDIGYTYDGRYYGNSTPTLSFTEYTLQGFSQERPIKLPEVGELCLVRDEGFHFWIAKGFISYNPDNEFPYITENDIPYKYMKRIKILD